MIYEYENGMRAFARSMRHAFRGLRHAFLRERNFQIELGLAILSIALAFALPLTQGERALILLLIAVVLPMELFNTACERIVDMLKPGLHPYAKMVKDLTAAAVLIASLLAGIIGISIFLPYVAEVLFAK